MKKVLLIILVCALYSPLQSQIWEQINSPYDYANVNTLMSFNGELYAGVYNRDIKKYANLKYENNEWFKEPNDTIYSLLGKPHSYSQFKNKIIVSTNFSLYISNDGGVKWELISNPIEGSGQLFDVDISDNGIFGISIGYGYPLVKYTEDDDKWEDVMDVRKDTTLPILVDLIESNSTRIFALQKNRKHPHTSMEKLLGGLYISSDKGSSWTKTLVDSALFNLYVKNNLIIVSTIYGNVLRSEDNGETWEITDNIGSAIKSILEDGERLLANTRTGEIIESRDDGRTWKLIANIVTGSQIYKKDGKYFFIGFAHKLYKADSTFTTVNKVKIKDFYSPVYNIYSQNDTLLITGAFKRGVQFSADNGQSWETYFQELDDNSFSVDELIRNDNTYICNAPGIHTESYYYSSDYGKTWGFYESYPYNGQIKDILILDDKIIISGKDGVTLSLDGGKTQVKMDTSVIKSDYGVGKIVKTQNGDLLAFTYYNGVYKSEDKAESWTKLVDSLPVDEEYISITDFFEFNDNYYAFNFMPASLLKSTDKGSSWHKMNIPLFEKFLYSFILMIDENTFITSSYAGQENGLRLTTDQGNTWSKIDNELTPLSDDILAYPILGKVGDEIYIKIGFKTVGVNIEQIYRTTLDKLGIKTSVETNPNSLSISPAYPQPARSEVTIDFDNKKYSLDKSSVTIFDMTGRKLENQAIDINNNSIQWDCSTAQPGIYLINIKHGTEENAVKVLVE